MKYDHLVKANGKFYWPGEDVPEPVESVAEIPGDDFTDEIPEDAPLDDAPVHDSDASEKYKEWQLKAMNRDKLVEICHEKGIEYTEDATKGILINLILEKQ